MVFIPGRSVSTENDRVFIDGEEVPVEDGQPIVSEGSQGAGDVVIGADVIDANPDNNIRSGTIASEPGATASGTTGNVNVGDLVHGNETQEGENMNPDDTQDFGDIRSADIFADEGETVVGNTEDVFVGNVDGSDISGSDRFNRVPTNANDTQSNNLDFTPSSTALFSEGNIEDVQSPPESDVADYFADNTEIDPMETSFDFDVTSDNAFW